MNGKYNGLIYLVGARACGKSTIGRKLADMLGVAFIDLDVFLREKAGRSIDSIVREEGWPKFRQLEAQCLVEASDSVKDKGAVIATGGGIVLAEANRKFMQAMGKVIWLAASADVLAERLSINPEAEQRPPLTDLSLREEIEHVLKEREPLYRECAAHVIDARQGQEFICSEIANFIVQKHKYRCAGQQ